MVEHYIYLGKSQIEMLFEPTNELSFRSVRINLNPGLNSLFIGTLEHAQNAIRFTVAPFMPELDDCGHQSKGRLIGN